MKFAAINPECARTLETAGRNARHARCCPNPMFDSRYPECERDGYRFVDTGGGSPPDRCVLLLHGMIGGPGNWDGAIPAVLETGYRAVVPRIPMFGLPRSRATVAGLTEWMVGFMDALDVRRPVVVGNSLGGHVAALLAIRHAERVSALGLVGSSGVQELDMGVAVMRRKDRDFIRQRAAITFHDPVHVTEQLLDSIMDTVNDRSRALRLIQLARSARRETVTDQLPGISVPTLVVWGRQDQVTPPSVAEILSRLVPRTTLHWVDDCGHAPMMEHPERFGTLLGSFLAGLEEAAV